VIVIIILPCVVVLYSQFLITALIIGASTSISVIVIIILPCVVVLYSQFLITALITALDVDAPMIRAVIRN
jgi:hypothetical protein